MPERALLISETTGSDDDETEDAVDIWEWLQTRGLIDWSTRMYLHILIECGFVRVLNTLFALGIVVFAASPEPAMCEDWGERLARSICITWSFVLLLYTCESMGVRFLL